MSEQPEPIHYSMVIEWEPDGQVFVVTVPELPGCRTHGRTYEDAVAQGQDAIETWIDAWRAGDRQPPAPRLFDLSEERHWDADSPGVLLILSGDDEDDALPYQERAVEAALATVKALEEAEPSFRHRSGSTE